jgi:hypothetical protein
MERQIIYIKLIPLDVSSRRPTLVGIVRPVSRHEQAIQSGPQWLYFLATMYHKWAK